MGIFVGKFFFVNFFRLTRPLSNVKNIALIFLAFYLSKNSFNLALFLEGLFALSFVCSAFYAYNTLSDYNSDKNNINKQHYSKAVDYFGKANSFIIFFILLISGFVIGFFVNLYFLSALIALALINFFYSSKEFRFKEKFMLDIVFGAFLTFLLRFVASWFIFKISLPPLLVLSGLVFAKSAGFIIYKDFDYEYLIKNNVRNSTTILNKKAKIIISLFLWFISFLSFIFLCLNSYYKIAILGSSPFLFLFLPLFAIPPILVIYLRDFNIINAKIKNLRTIGFIYWLLVIFIILKLL